MWCPGRTLKFLGHSWVTIWNPPDNPHYGEKICRYCYKPKADV